MFSTFRSNDSSFTNSPVFVPPDLTPNADWGNPASRTAAVRRERGDSLEFAAAETRPIIRRTSRSSWESSGRIFRRSASSRSADSEARDRARTRDTPGKITKEKSRISAAAAPPSSRTIFSRLRSTAVSAFFDQDRELHRTPAGASLGLPDGHRRLRSEAVGEGGAEGLENPSVGGFPGESKPAGVEGDLTHQDLPFLRKGRGDFPEHRGRLREIAPQLLLLPGERLDLLADLGGLPDDHRDPRDRLGELLSDLRLDPGALLVFRVA